MFIYAVINENKICTGYSQLISEIKNENNILIPETSNPSDYIFKKYDVTTKEWSTDKYEPVADVPIDRLDIIEKRTSDLENLILQGQGVI